MKCSICGCGLANDLKGREIHMKRYHAVTLEAPKPQSYKPMDPKEKAEKVRRMEARLAGKIVLDEHGQLINYGEIAEATPAAFDDGSAIDDAKLDLWPTKPTVLPEPAVEPVQDVTPVVTEAVPEVVEEYRMPESEFIQRLDALVATSEDVLKKLKEKFGE